MSDLLLLLVDYVNVIDDTWRVSGTLRQLSTFVKQVLRIFLDEIRLTVIKRKYWRCKRISALAFFELSLMDSETSHFSPPPATAVSCGIHVDTPLSIIRKVPNMFLSGAVPYMSY